MSLKESFENHPVVCGLTLLTTGFIAGFSARSYVIPTTTPELQCTVEGLPTLEEARTKQIADLNYELVRLEKKASDHGLIKEYQDKYRESADRIRADIEKVNITYLSALEALSKKCK